MKALIGYGVPLNRRRLLVGDDIADCGVGFFQNIPCADQHIVKMRLARTVGYGVFVHFKTRKRSAIEMKGYALVQAVLRGFGNNEIAPFQHIVECDRRRLTAHNGNTANLLRLISVVALLGDGVNAGSEVVDLNFSVFAGLNDFIYAFTCNSKGDSLNNIVLAGFYDFGGAVADFDIYIAFYGVADRLCIGDGILYSAVGAVNVIRPCDNASSLGVFLFGGNRDGVDRRFVGGDRQLIATYGKSDSRIACRKREIREDIVFVGQRGSVFPAVPCKFNVLCFTC